MTGTAESAPILKAVGRGFELLLSYIRVRDPEKVTFSHVTLSTYDVVIIIICRTVIRR